MILKGWRVEYFDPKTEKREQSRLYHAKGAADVLAQVAEANGMLQVKILTVQGRDHLEPIG